MTDPDYVDVRVTRRRLPDATIFELELADGTHLSLVNHHGSGGSEFSLRPQRADEAAAHARLTEPEASTVAALLSSVRLSIEDALRPHGRGAHIEVIRIGAESTAIGRRPGEITVSDPEGVRILAVVRDDTPQLIEDDTVPCRAGDRLIVVGRPAAVAALREELL